MNSLRDRDTLVSLSEGNYNLGWGAQEYVGGPLQIYNQTHYMAIYGGNPGLYLPQSLINQYTIKTVQLPGRQYFQDVTPASYAPGGMQYLVGGGIMSTVNLTDPKCQTTLDDINLIGVFPNNDQWYYDARVKLDQNTIDKPLYGSTGICSNVVKNFLNRKYKSICLFLRLTYVVFFLCPYFAC
jgi:hypothetical protein